MKEILEEIAKKNKEAAEYKKREKQLVQENAELRTVIKELQEGCEVSLK